MITADAGYHSEANRRALAAQGSPTLIAHTGMRARDERFATQARNQQSPDPLHGEPHASARSATARRAHIGCSACARPAGRRRAE